MFLLCVLCDCVLVFHVRALLVQMLHRTDVSVVSLFVISYCSTSLVAVMSSFSRGWAKLSLELMCRCINAVADIDTLSVLGTVSKSWQRMLRNPIIWSDSVVFVTRKLKDSFHSELLELLKMSKAVVSSPQDVDSVASLHLPTYVRWCAVRCRVGRQTLIMSQFPFAFRRNGFMLRWKGVLSHVVIGLTNCEHLFQFSQIVRSKDLSSGSYFCGVRVAFHPCAKETLRSHLVSLNGVPQDGETAIDGRSLFTLQRDEDVKCLAISFDFCAGKLTFQIGDQAGDILWPVFTLDSEWRVALVCYSRSGWRSKRFNAGPADVFLQPVLAYVGNGGLTNMKQLCDVCEYRRGKAGIGVCAYCARIYCELHGGTEACQGCDACAFCIAGLFCPYEPGMFR